MLTLSRSFIHLCILTVLCELLTGQVVWAETGLALISTTVHNDTHTVDWSLTYRAAPDFLTVDAYNRQRDSFQIYLFDTPLQADHFNNPDGIGQVRGVLRGEELHYGEGLPIRTGVPEPHAADVARSGGWGDIRATVPVTQVDRLLTFTTPLSALGVSGKGPFGYGYGTFSFGSSDQNFLRCSSAVPCSVALPGTPDPKNVPIPDTLWPFAIGFGLVIAVLRRRTLFIRPHL